MKYLKTYNTYLESIKLDSEIEKIIDITESLSVIDDHLLSSILAEEKQIYDEFNYLVDSGKNIEFIINDDDFIRELSKLGYKPSEIENTDDFQTFIDKTIKFCLIRKKEDNELNNPEFILIQTWNETTSKWEDVRLYKVNDDINKFYNKLTSKTVEFVINDINFIYKTSNSGNNWELQNTDNETSDFKRILTKDEIKLLAKKNNLKITII
jgi:hypothetical protein